MGTTANRTSVRRSPHLEDTLFLSADFRQQRFDRHFHEEFAIGIIDSGCQAFSYDTSRRLDMPGGSVALIAPGVVHTGWSLRAGGWRYRMFYPSEELVRRAAEDLFGSNTLPSFHKPVVEDVRLFELLDRLHRAADEPDGDPWEIQALYLAIIGRALVGHAGQRAPSLGRPDTFGLKRVREAIEASCQHQISLDELGSICGLGKFRLWRQFQSAYGVPPHAYLRLVRVRRARKAILSGNSLADAAFQAGFADQPHMTRAFRKTLGYTPGALAGGLQ